MHAHRTPDRFLSVRTLFIGSLLLFTLLLMAPTVSEAAAPAIFYSDLDSGPNTGGENNKGVFVTVSGKNFGATRGSGSVTVGGGQVDNYPLWSDSKIIVQLGASTTTGNIVVTSSTFETSNGVPFTVRAGSIYFVSVTGTGNGLAPTTPMSPSAAYNVMGPGKTFYFRAGTYNSNYSGGGVYSYANYALDQAHGGTQGQPMAMVGYPNETAIFQYQDITRPNILLGNGGAPANYVTFANFTLRGGAECFDDGGFYTNANSGGVGVRLINNILSAAYGDANTMAGMVMIQNNYWKVLGNEFKDTGTGAPINNNHAVYNQSGASYTEIAWNYFHDLRMGHVIQVHTDPFYTYTNVSIHDNVIAKGTNGDSRGINVGNAINNSYGAIYNNIIDTVGQDFSGIAVYSGTWKIYNNTLYNVHATEGAIWVSNFVRLMGGAPSNWSPPTAEIRNNIIYSDGQSPYISAIHGASLSQITMSNNLYYNFGAAPSQDAAAVTGNPLFINPTTGNFQLQSGSPAKDRGTSSGVNGVVAKDHNGLARPQGGAFDIGAYETTGASLPKPVNVTVIRQ
jgi:hypothetical protein